MAARAASREGVVLICWEHQASPRLSATSDEPSARRPPLAGRRRRSGRRPVWVLPQPSGRVRLHKVAQCVSRATSNSPDAGGALGEERALPALQAYLHLPHFMFCGAVNNCGYSRDARRILSVDECRYGQDARSGVKPSPARLRERHEALGQLVRLFRTACACAYAVL